MKLNNKIVTDCSFYREILSIFLPVVLQSCINQGVNMMDTIMVGTLGDATISASSLANQFYSFFNCLCMGLSGAGLVLSAQSWGARDTERVCRVFDLLLQLIAVFSALFGAVTALFPEQIMSLYINDPEVIRQGAAYLRITALVYLPHGVSLIFINVMRSVGNAKLGLITSAISFFINIGTNYIFIFGKLGLPAMGLAGAALGTLCARVTELFVCTVFVLKKDKNLGYNLLGTLQLPSFEMLEKFIKVGLPVVIGDLLLALSANAVSWILGHMGKEFVSSYAIVQVIERMCTIAAGGAASAAGVMVGHLVGAKEYRKAQLAANTFFVIALIIGAIGAGLILALGQWSISLYNVTPETVQIASSMMAANAIIVVFQIIQSIMGKGVLRGGGDTKFVMFTDVVYQWLVSIPLGYLFGIRFGLTPFFVLLAVRSDYMIKGTVYFFRTRSSKWINNTRGK